MKNAGFHGICKTFVASFLALGALLPSQAAEVTAIRRGVYNNWGYIVTSANTVHIRTWLGKSGYREEVVVPGEIEGLPVTRIENSANWDLKPDPWVPDWRAESEGLNPDDPSNRELNCGRLVVDGKGNMVIGGAAFVDDTLHELVLKGVKEIESNHANDSGAFRRCKNLVRVIADDALEVIGGQAFYENPNLECLIGATNLKRIGYLAFSSDPKLKDVPVSGKLEYIDGYAFQDCTSITNVVFPNSLTGLAEHAFRGCDFIEEVTFGSGLKTITGANFNAKPRLRKITIPEGVEAIADHAFAGCSALPEVVFPDSLKDPGYWSFADCPAITNIVIGKNGGMAYVRDSVFSADKMLDLDTVTINGNGETAINGKPGAFNGFKMRHLALNGVKTIEDTNSGGAFRNCTNLVSVAADDALEYIGNWAFMGCTALTTLDGFRNVTSIGGSAFADCTSLLSINIPSNVGKISGDAFARCTSATTVVIPASVTNVGDWVFRDCNAITSMSIGKGVNPIVQNLVPQGAEDLDTIIVKGNGETVIAGGAFFRCKMRHLVMSGVKTIDGSCKECLNLEDVVADEALETIGEETFRACPKLRSVTGITGVKVIGNSAFGNFHPERGCPALAEIELPEGLERIGECAFANCTNLTDVTVPDTVTNVGWRVWMQCHGLTNFTFGAGLNPIPGGLFDWFEGAMDELTVNGDGTTAIADGAFSGMKIDRAVLNGVAKVGSTAFQNNTMLTEVHFDGDAPTVGANAFGGTASDCTAYVPYGSTGWDVDIPLTGKADWNYDGIPGHSIKIAYANAPSGDVGAWLRFDLVNDLDIVIPEDVDYAIGDKVTVKVEGLAKGLKLVTTQLKETTGKKAVTNVVYTIEGVPTEEIDFETRPMYARVTVTYKDKTVGDKGKVESLQPIPLSITAAKVRTLAAGVLNKVYEPVDIAALWPEVADAEVNPKDWSFKGWPAGIKYNNKETDANWSYKEGGATVKTNAGPWTVYGQPTKAGVYPVTATWKHKLDDSKTTVSETFSAVLTVWGDDGATDFRYTDQAYVETKTKTLDATWKSFSGLPAGIKYTTKLVAADTKKGTSEYPAFSLYGTPTKPGIFAVTATKVDQADAKKTVKETFLWKVTEGENPGLGATDIDWSNSWIKYDADATHTVRMPQGLSVDLPVSASALASGAKVTVSGLPSGLKYDAKTGRITGVATKAESKVVTVKVVQNGVTVTTTFAIRVDANPFAGTYYGFFLKEAERHVATAVITPAAGGTAKLVFDEYVPSLEKTVKYTATAKGFTMNGWYTLVDWFNPGGMENDCVSVIYDFTLKADAKNNPDFAAGERTMRVCLAWTESEGFGSTKGSGITLTKARSPVAAKLAGGARLQMTGTTRIYGQIVKALNAADYGKILDLGLPAPTPILTGTCTNETGHVLYYSAAFDAKKVQYQVAGKLADGTTVKTLLPLALAECGWTTAAFLLQEKKGARRTFAGLFEMDIEMDEMDIEMDSFGCWTAEALNVSKCSAFDALPATAAEQLGGERELGCESELVLDAAELTASGFEGEAPAFRFVVNGTSWAKAKLDIYAPGAEEGAKPLASLASAKLQASAGYVFKGSFKWDAKVGGDGNTYSFELVPSAADGKTFVGRCEVKPAKGAVITVSGFMRDYEQPSGLGGVQLWENGPYWAECNVGATKPEEYGYYFWWGDTVGYKRNASNDAWESVKTGASFTFSTDNCPTYGMTTEQLQSDGYIDSTDNLAAEYDAATVHLGAPWRMPTDAEMSALISNCTTVWTNNWNDTGVNGQLVTGKGAYASKSIFLPAAGYGYDSDFDSPGSGGGFWSSTPNSDYSDYAWSLGFYSGYFSRSSNYRYRGRSVRPVRGFAK